MKSLVLFLALALIVFSACTGNTVPDTNTSEGTSGTAQPSVEQDAVVPPELEVGTQDIEDTTASAQDALDEW